jgi:hypothetical protein
LFYGQLIFASGGAGYVLSNRALDMLIQNDFQQKCQPVRGGIPSRTPLPIFICSFIERTFSLSLSLIL